MLSLVTGLMTAEGLKTEYKALDLTKGSMKRCADLG